MDDASTMFRVRFMRCSGLNSNVTLSVAFGNPVAVTMSSSVAADGALAFDSRSVNRFAVHYQTGKPIPQTLVIASRSQPLYQGFITVDIWPQLWSI